MSGEETPAREFRAPAASEELEQLREAYLGLLKLGLCDLVGPSTETAYLSYDKSVVFRREPDEEELEYRKIGKDWPLHGVTMVGLARLDDLQRCVEAIVADGVDGDLIEAGAWRGGASILMRATLNCLGASDRLVHVADSFAGFPDPDPERFDADSDLDLSPHDFLVAPLEQVKETFARLGCEEGVRFVKGFFRDTLPTLRGKRWSLVRLDGDTYEATWLALEALYPGLARGGFLIVDDYGFVPACRQAVDEYRRQHGIEEPLERVDWNCVRWRRADEPAGEPADVDVGDATTSKPGLAFRSRLVPTARELELEREVRQLKRQLGG